jgi:hypothetical protein
MLEKLIQAAIITFLLHLLAGISADTSIPSKPSSSFSKTPSAMPAVDEAIAKVNRVL